MRIAPARSYSGYREMPVVPIPGWWMMKVMLGFAGGLAALYERQEVRPLRRETSVLPEDFGKYLGARADVAAELGFRFCSAYPSVHYKLVVATWMSDDAKLLLVGCEGTVFGMPYKRTRFYSRIHGGEVLVTTDDAEEPDLSGRTEAEVFMNADMPFLFQAHRERIADMPGETIPFDCKTGADILEDIARSRAERLVELGWAKWTDPVLQDSWKYTIRGVRSIAWQQGNANYTRTRIWIKS